MDERSATQTAATAFAVAFLAIGILGFVPGVTTHYGEMSFAGDDSGSELLGIFGFSILHGIVYLLLGIAGLTLARTVEGAARFLAGGAAILLLLWLLGIVGAADWLPSNTAHDWLHFALGVAMAGAALLARRAASG